MELQKNGKTPKRRPQVISWNVELPLDYPCQIYPRVSTPEQIKNVSAEMQKDKSFAISCGWTGKYIFLDDRDLGVSGQIKMEDRPAFKTLLRRIANGEVKAIIASNVDRLFRNKWGDEPGKFMEICFRYGVIVVTPDFVYDFGINWHIERFKRRCEEAWNYLEYHVYGRLHPAQDARGYAGYWTGGNMPMGYILDIREKINGFKNPSHYRYIIYKPHAEVICWLFRRFKQLNGNVGALMREIETKAVLFPDFDEAVDPFIVQACFSQYTKVPGGYTIVSDRGLRNVLVNRVYIGYWVYKGEQVSTESHEPIVDIDTFTYAYNRLSATKLDGTPNEDAVEGRGKRYRKQHFGDKPAILKECIQAKDPKVKIYSRDTKLANNVRIYYGFYPEGVGRVRASASYTIVASELDKVVLERLREHLQTPETERQFQNFTTVEGEVIDEASETLNDIERDIEATKALMARIKAQIRSGKLTDPDLLEEANESFATAKEELQRLENRRGTASQIAHEDEERRSYKKLMQDVGEAWEEIVFPEEHPRLVYLFIKSVTLDIVSPNFFSVTVEWRDSSWSIDSGLCCKGSFASLAWTKEEIEILSKHYPTVTRKELTELLPRRSYQAMRGYFSGRGIKIQRPVRKEEGIPYHVCLEDWKVMQQYGITEDKRATWRSVVLVTWCFPPR
jgi:Resolvase, N terminal domain